MTYVSEAHLPVGDRSVSLVRHFRTMKRRKAKRISKPPNVWLHVSIIVGLYVLNEVRGIYVVAEFLKAWTQA